MPTIKNLLHNHDEDVRRSILARWGFELPAELTVRDLQKFSEAAVEEGVLLEIVQTLPKDAGACFYYLLKKGGKMPWSQFSRIYGDIRVMGAGKRERLHPDREPVNESELLWYSGLIGKAFFKTKPEPIEFAYVPDEIQELLKDSIQDHGERPGKELVFPKGCFVQRAHDYILDDLCTLLAGLRMGFNLDAIQPMRGAFSNLELMQFLTSMKLFHRKTGLAIDAVQEHLTKPRLDAFYDVLQNWQQSRMIQDVLFIPGLDFGKKPQIDFLAVRQRTLSIFKKIPADIWWDLDAMIREIKAGQPEFLRVAGDMEAWYVQDRSTGASLSGFEHWEEVEGVFILFFTVKMLHGLGLCDLAVERKSGKVLGIRWIEERKALLEKPALSQEEETGSFYSLAQGNLCMSPACSRSLRYQIARFCEWKGMRRGEYQYQVTPASLQKATGQGLQVNQFTALLKKHQTQRAAPGLLNALQCFEKGGGFARIHASVLLRIEDAAIMRKIKQSEVSKYIVEELNATTLLIDKKGIEHFQAKLTELGYLCDVNGEL